MDADHFSAALLRSSLAFLTISASCSPRPTSLPSRRVSVTVQWWPPCWRGSGREGCGLGLALRPRTVGWEGSRDRAPTALEQGREGADRRRDAGAGSGGERGRPAARRSADRGPVRRQDRRARHHAVSWSRRASRPMRDRTVQPFARERHRGRGRSRTHQDLNLAIRQYPEQPETEHSTKVAKPGVVLTPPPAR